MDWYLSPLLLSAQQFRPLLLKGICKGHLSGIPSTSYSWNTWKTPLKTNFTFLCYNCCGKTVQVPPVPAGECAGSWPLCLCSASPGPHPDCRLSTYSGLFSLTAHAPSDSPTAETILPVGLSSIPHHSVRFSALLPSPHCRHS